MGISDIDVKKMLEATIGKSEKEILGNPLLAMSGQKADVEKSLNEVKAIIKQTIDDKSKLPKDKVAAAVIDALNNNDTIKTAVAGLNKDGGAIGISGVKVENIKDSLDAWVEANVSTKVAAASKGAKNDKKAEATKSADTKIAPPAAPTQTASQKSEEIAAAEAADKKAKEEKAKLEEKNKNPLLDFLKNIPIIGPIIAMIMGAGGDKGGDKKESTTQVASANAPSGNGDVALSSPTPAVPAQGQSKQSEVLPPVATPNPPKAVGGKTP